MEKMCSRSPSDSWSDGVMISPYTQSQCAPLSPFTLLSFSHPPPPVCAHLSLAPSLPLLPSLPLAPPPPRLLSLSLPPSLSSQKKRERTLALRDLERDENKEEKRCEGENKSEIRKEQSVK